MQDSHIYLCNPFYPHTPFNSLAPQKTISIMIWCISFHLDDGKICSFVLSTCAFNLCKLYCSRDFFLLLFLCEALSIFKKETFTLFRVHLLCYFSQMSSIPCVYSITVYLPTPPVIAWLFQLLAKPNSASNVQILIYDPLWTCIWFFWRIYTCHGTCKVIGYGFIW